MGASNANICACQRTNFQLRLLCLGEIRKLMNILSLIFDTLGLNFSFEIDLMEDYSLETLPEKLREIKESSSKRFRKSRKG